MLKFPDIKKSDIKISEKYSQGYDEVQCVEALWSIYNLIKKMTEEKSNGIGCLYSVGILGLFNSDNSSVLVDYQKKDKNARAHFADPNDLFSLEKYGFSINGIKLRDDNKPKAKWNSKDILEFNISHKDSDLLLGLKLFTATSGKQEGISFYTGDIRIMFDGAPRLFTAPIDEVCYFLLAEQKEQFYMLHNIFERLNCTHYLESQITCTRYVERSYTSKYVHPKSKGKTFASIYVDTNIRIKLNLRHISNYTDYLDECIESVRQTILTPPKYGNANTGISFEYNGIKHYMDLFHAFQFDDFSEQAVINYMKLIELEDKELRTKRTK